MSISMSMSKPVCLSFLVYSAPPIESLSHTLNGAIRLIISFDQESRLTSWALMQATIWQDMCERQGFSAGESTSGAVLSECDLQFNWRSIPPFAFLKLHQTIKLIDHLSPINDLYPE